MWAVWARRALTRAHYSDASSPARHRSGQTSHSPGSSHFALSAAIPYCWDALLKPQKNTVLAGTHMCCTPPPFAETAWGHLIPIALHFMRHVRIAKCLHHNQLEITSSCIHAVQISPIVLSLTPCVLAARFPLIFTLLLSGSSLHLVVLIQNRKS